VDCGGKSICPHRRLKRNCVECNGAEICDHRLIRRGCSICSPYKCQGCALYMVRDLNIEGKRLCRTCNPFSCVRAQYEHNRPEMQVNRFLSDNFTLTYPVGTYAPFRSCGDRKFPDTVVRAGDMMFIIETDECSHENYELSCEWAKALQHGQSAFQTEGVSRVCFIRINPNNWWVAGKPLKYKMKERFEDLKQLMQRQITSQKDAYTLFHMFYPSQDEEKIKQVSVQDIQAWFDELAGLSSGEALT
jgi:hypothetical protein